MPQSPTHHKVSAVRVYLDKMSDRVFQLISCSRQTMPKPETRVVVRNDQPGSIVSARGRGHSR
jgi:hypothetical protein